MHEERERPYVLTLLPGDLESSAWQSAALLRCRHIPDAKALLRLALAYAVSDLSLKDVAAWAHALGVAEITEPGLFYRLREAEGWLQHVLAQTLQSQVASAAGSSLRLRVVDATVLHGPGAQGTEWRAQVLMDPGTGAFRAVELTDAHGGEGYGRYQLSPQELILGDRAYATARGLWAVHSAHVYVVARLNPHTIRVCDAERKRLSLRRKEREIPPVGGIEFNILVPIPPEKRTKTHQWGLRRAMAWVPARAVAARTRDGSVIWLLTHLVDRASLVLRTDAALPLALADRVVLQAAEVVVASERSAFPPGTDGQILDAGTLPGGCPGSEVSTTGRSPFPLGVRDRPHTGTPIAPGRASA